MISDVICHCTLFKIEVCSSFSTCSVLGEHCMFNDEYKNSRSKCGFVGTIRKMKSVATVEPKLQLRSIQKTVLDDQYGLPHQVSCGSFLPVLLDDNLPNLGDSDVAIIGSQQNLSRRCTIQHSTRESVVEI